MVQTLYKGIIDTFKWLCLTSVLDPYTYMYISTMYTISDNSTYICGAIGNIRVVTTSIANYLVCFAHIVCRTYF